jgi:uncharacterized membrane protein
MQSGKPMFLFAGAYDRVASAEGDYEVIKILHSVGEIGPCDAAVIAMPQDRRVEVHKAEKPTEKGAWIGLAARAGGAMVLPHLLPSLLASGVPGAGLGAWFGHISHGISRVDAKAMRELIDEGRAALIVVGVQNDASRIEQTAVEASRASLKHLPDADFEAAEREAIEAMAQTADALSGAG